VSSTLSFILLSLDKPVYLESKTSANELTLDIDIFTRSTYRILVRALTNPSPKILLNRRSKKKPVRVDRGSSIGYRGL